MYRLAFSPTCPISCSSILILPCNVIRSSSDLDLFSLFRPPFLPSSRHRRLLDPKRTLLPLLLEPGRRLVRRRRRVVELVGDDGVYQETGLGAWPKGEEREDGFAVKDRFCF
jgi:hypothetical protein